MDRFGARQDAANAAIRLPPQQPQSAADKASAWLDTQLEPAPTARQDDSLYPDFRCRLGPSAQAHLPFVMHLVALHDSQLMPS